MKLTWVQDVPPRPKLSWLGPDMAIIGPAVAAGKTEAFAAVAGPRGPQGPAGADLTATWVQLAHTWTTRPTVVATGVTHDGEVGRVAEYVGPAETTYRFVPDDYDPHHDAFYSGWNGTILTGLIMRRTGETI